MNQFSLLLLIDLINFLKRTFFNDGLWIVETSFLSLEQLLDFLHFQDDQTFHNRFLAECTVI